MIEDLAGKVVLVTGSSTGIGAAVAVAFGQNRARVAVHYHQSRDAAVAVAAEVVEAGGEAVVLQGDVSRSEVAARLVEDTVRTFGRIDVLVNNAGDPVRRVPIADSTDDLVRAVFDLNVLSVISACRAAIPHFRAQGGGVIISTASVAGRIGGGIGGMMYGSSKAYVINLTRGLAKELAPHRIRVNAVSPGVIATPFQVRNNKPDVLKALESSIPLGSIGTPQQCAGTYLYLASEQLSGYVTGQTIEVNGGQWMT